MNPGFPPDFLALPDEVQRQIMRDMEATIRLAYDRTLPVLISSPPRAPVKLVQRSGSGFLVQVDGQTYLGTALHVWTHFLERRASGEDVIFQTRGFAIRADQRIVWTDTDRDLAFIPVSSRQADRSGAAISPLDRGWPPPPPKPDSFVLFSGCPETHRGEAPDDHIEFGSFSSVMRVTTAGEHHLVCQFERESWIWDSPEPPPQPGADLSGMSGGPVFSLEGPSPSLVGLISEFSSNLELLSVRTFAGIPTLRFGAPTA